ncbi:MAG: hypothetical protein ACREX8_07240 [Gammaproteobacteria bacterium]
MDDETSGQRSALARVIFCDPAPCAACVRLSRGIQEVRRMGVGDIVVMTDHGLGEGGRPLLEAAVEVLTATRPMSIDARTS